MRKISTRTHHRELYSLVVKPETEKKKKKQKLQSKTTMPHQLETSLVRTQFPEHSNSHLSLNFLHIYSYIHMTIATAPNGPDRLTTLVLEWKELRDKGRTVIKETTKNIINTFKTQAHALKEKTHLATQRVMDTFNPEFVYGKKETIDSRARSLVTHTKSKYIRATRKKKWYEKPATRHVQWDNTTYYTPEDAHTRALEIAQQELEKEQNQEDWWEQRNRKKKTSTKFM